MVVVVASKLTYELLDITLKFSILLLLYKLLGSLRVATRRSDSEPDEPHHSVSYFCQMLFPHIGALFHAVAHIYIDTVICLYFLWSADGGK